MVMCILFGRLIFGSQNLNNKQHLSHIFDFLLVIDIAPIAVINVDEELNAE